MSQHKRFSNSQDEFSGNQQPKLKRRKVTHKKRDAETTGVASLTQTLTPIETKQQLAETNGFIPGGRIIQIDGPMYAMKTTRLLAEGRKAEIGRSPKRTFWICSKKDVRYQSEVDTKTGKLVYHMKTHDLVSRVVDCACDVLQEADAAVIASNADIVLVDEGQFYADLCEYVRKWRRLGMVVYVSGLKADKYMNPWPEMAKLNALADERIECLATCAECGKPAAHTIEIKAPGSGVGAGTGTGTMAGLGSASPQIKVGSHGMYEARCYDCYELGMRI